MACETLAANGIRSWFVNKSSPTPLIMYYVMAHDLPYGMMVTASHNPAIYNGIKVFTRGGRDADQEQTQEIENYIRNVEADIEAGKAVPRMDYEEAKNAGWLWNLIP